ncbi:tetratricopeptide repeat protein [Priestia megaterium]|nr:tetratricopeptide repeat protein [Priestia megaterium]
MKIDIDRVKEYVDRNQIFDALLYIRKDFEYMQNEASYSFLKKELASIQTSDRLYELIRLCDDALMYKYSSFLTRYGYRRFGTFQMTTFFCDELVKEGRTIEAKEKMQLLLKQSNLQEHSFKKIENAYFLMVRIFLDLKRVDEAYEWMEKLKLYNKTSLYDKWGYFYFQIGEWEKAESYLTEGINKDKKADMCYVLLADLYAFKGEHECALKLVEEGIKKFPQLPSLHMEKVRRLRDLKRDDEIITSLEYIEDRLLNHDYQDYFAHLRADVYFETGEIEKLSQVLQQESCLTESPYATWLKKKQGVKVKLPVIPIVQKDNYCVPASLSMILQLLHEPKTQDEVGQHVYGDLGSKLSTAVEYMESLQFNCKFFTGSIDRYKQLLDKELPILASVEFEHASHVQVIFGYDDQLQVLYVQDPNFLSPVLIKYDDFEKTYANSGFLSIVASPTSQALTFLSEEEDQFIRKMYELTDYVEENEEKYIKSLVDLLQAHTHIPFANIFALKHIYRKEYQTYIEGCIANLLKVYPEQDYMKLHAAYSLFRFGNTERAADLLNDVKEKRHSSFYYYIQGRIYLDADRYTKAIKSFRKSLQLDLEQHVVWSYLGLSYMYKGELNEALEMSTTSLNMYNRESFTQLNHGLILAERQQFKEARKIFNELLSNDRSDALLWYERAKCDQQLGKVKKAYRGFTVAKQLQADVPYPYLALADLHEYQEDNHRAEQILLEGIQKVDYKVALYHRLGDFYVSNEQYHEAIELYDQELKNEQNPLLYIGLAHAYIQQGEIKKGIAKCQEIQKQFANDGDTLLDAGNMLLQACEDHQLNDKAYKLGLTLLESGLSLSDQDMNEALEIYIRSLEKTKFIERGRLFLTQQWRQKPEEISYICYAGILLESEKRYEEAISHYEQALEVRQSVFPYYRLAEVYKLMENVDKAKYAYKMCITLDDRHTVSYMNLAEIAHIEENSSEERYYLLQWLLYEPMEVNIEHMASLCETEEDFEALLHVLKKVEEDVLPLWLYDSLAYVYGSKGNFEKEQFYIEKALEVDGEYEAVQHHYAKWLIRHEQYKKAVSIMTALIQHNVEDTDLYQTLMQSFNNVKELLTLPTLLKKMRMEQKERSILYMNAASALEQHMNSMEEGEAAGSFLKRTFLKFKERTKTITLLGLLIELYETAVKLDDENTDAVHYFATFYEEKGMIDEAVEVLQKSLQIKWDFDVAYHLANLLLKVEDNEEVSKEALSLVQTLLKEEPKHIDLCLYEAYILSDLNQYEQAELKFQHLLAQNIYEPNIYAGLSKLYNKLEQYENAIAVCQKGLERGQVNDQIYIELGIAYHLAGQTEVAASLMNERLAKGEDLFIRYNLACYLASLGQLEQSQKQLDEVLRNDETGEFFEMAKEDEDLQVLYLNGKTKVMDNRSSRY